PTEKAIANVEKSLDALMANGTIPILSTIPPRKADKAAPTEAYNAEIKKLAEKKKIPLLDLYGEMKAVDSNVETFLCPDGVHLSYAGGPTEEPTAENFKKCGYLMRCYVNVIKAMEVKAHVLDAK